MPGWRIAAQLPPDRTDRTGMINQFKAAPSQLGNLTAGLTDALTHGARVDTLCRAPSERIICWLSCSNGLFVGNLPCKVGSLPKEINVQLARWLFVHGAWPCRVVQGCRKSMKMDKVYFVQYHPAGVPTSGDGQALTSATQEV
jgi:hypothetical protein